MRIAVLGMLVATMVYGQEPSLVDQVRMKRERAEREAIEYVLTQEAKAMLLSRLAPVRAKRILEETREVIRNNPDLGPLVRQRLLRMLELLQFLDPREWRRLINGLPEGCNPASKHLSPITED